MIWKERAIEAELVDKRYDFIIDEEHQWSRWAAPKNSDGSFDHDSALTGYTLESNGTDDNYSILALEITNDS